MALGYAKFLNHERVYGWYHPDHTWVTVVGGDILIWPFAAALYWLGFPWWLNALFYISLHICAGLPIIAWQRARAKKRRAIVEAIRSGNAT